MQSQKGGKFMEKKQDEVMKKSREIISMKSFATDPNGSYTGVPEDYGERPVQDADDL